MNTFTVLWIGWAVAFAVIEGVALFNSKRGDTLSEHLWAWLGVRKTMWKIDRMQLAPGPVVTPKWTLRVARIVFIALMAWITLHITTGGWV